MKKSVIVILIILGVLVFLLIIGKNKNQAIKDSRGAYETFLKEELYIDYFDDSLHFNVQGTRYTIRDVDGDGIDELFVCRGNSNIDGVLVFGYDFAKQKVIYIGSISSFGSVKIKPKGKIISQYGAMGVYYNVETKLVGNDLILCGITLIDGSTEEIKYYIDFPQMELNADGSLSSFPNSKEAKCVTEEEYLEHCKTKGEVISISYDDMIPIK